MKNQADFNKTGIPFSDTASVFPITLSDEVSGIKATVDFDEEMGEFTFDINGEPLVNSRSVETIGTMRRRKEPHHTQRGLDLVRRRLWVTTPTSTPRTGKWPNNFDFLPRLWNIS